MHSSISKKECTCDRLPEPFQMQFKADVNVIVDICVFLIVLILPLYKIKLPGRKYDTLINIISLLALSRGAGTGGSGGAIAPPKFLDSST